MGQMCGNVEAAVEVFTAQASLMGNADDRSALGIFLGSESVVISGEIRILSMVFQVNPAIILLNTVHSHESFRPPFFPGNIHLDATFTKNNVPH